MATIDFYYSAHSSYAYLGCKRLYEIAAAAGRTVAHYPIDLSKVVPASGSKSFADKSDAYRKYFFERELQRWSQFRGAPMIGRARFHHHDITLANCTLTAGVLSDLDVGPLALAYLTAHWRDDADLADRPTLASLISGVGMDADALLAAALEAPAREAYTANTEAAIERGMFGSPTFIVDGDMFYGQDRLEMVERAIEEPFAQGWSGA
ncbi:MAG: DsbA family protein [Pseudomonadota bacterium]